MSSFMTKDKFTYRFLIDLPAKKRLEQELQINIVNPAHLKELFDPDNVERLIDAMHLVLDNHGDVEPATFGAALHGSFQAAKLAFVEELRNFFREYGREKLAAVLDKTIELLQRENAEAAALVNSDVTNNAVQQLIDNAKKKYADELAKHVGGIGSTSKPDSQA